MDAHEATRFRLHLMALTRRLRAEHRRDVGPAALLTLGAIDRLGSAASPGALADDLRMARPNMSALLRRLEDDGWVARKQSADDGRRRRVSLTAAGREVLRRDRESREGWLREAAERTLSAEECRTLLAAGDLMQRLADLPSDPPADRLPAEDSPGCRPGGPA